VLKGIGRLQLGLHLLRVHLVMRMFKNTITSLVIPISIGMFFLLLLLGYLVNSAATLKESLFEDTVNETLVDLSKRIDPAGKTGFFAKLAGGLNQTVKILSLISASMT